MKAKLLIIICLTVHTSVFAQVSRSSIELNPFLRFDSYPEISYNYSNRASTDYLKMEGISWGVNLNYKKPVLHRLNLKAGIGYYKYSFNDLKRTNTSFGESSSRPIGYPSTLFILFHTDRYWYNTISGLIGFETWFPVKKDVKLITGINYNQYFSYSQHYHLTYDGPSDEVDNNYKVDDSRFFGSSINLTAGFIKNLKKISVGSSLIIPIYDNWKKDKQFSENANESRHKWFSGLGLGITLSKELQF